MVGFYLVPANSTFADSVEHGPTGALENDDEEKKTDGHDPEPSLHPGDSLPPWDRAKLLADIRSQEVITARGGEPAAPSGVHKPLAQSSNRARSIALWIALSIAVSMLLMFAYIAQ